MLGAVLLRGEQPLGVARRPARSCPRSGSARARRPSHLTMRLGRRADQREPVELEQEEVRRRVDPAQRAVELERRGGRRPLGALRERRSGTRRRRGCSSLHARRAARARAGRESGGAARRACRRARRSTGALRARLERVRVAVQHLRDAARRDRSGGACRRRRSGSPAAQGRRPAAAPSARASRRSRSRRSRRRARRAPRPRRGRRAGSPQPTNE